MAIRALPLSFDGASPPPTNCRPSVWYSEFDRNHEISPCWSLPVLYPHTHHWRRQPKSCFGENQLFPDSISFSLLTTSHPKALNDLRVRASIILSNNFTLLMASSSGFGSYISYSRAIHARFPLSSAPEGLSYARYTHSPAHSSIGMPSWFVLADKPLRPLVSTRFQVYFTPLSGFFSPFPHGTGSLSVIGRI